MRSRFVFGVTLISGLIAIGALSAATATPLVTIVKIAPRAYTNANKPAPLNLANGTLYFKNATKAQYTLTSYGTGTTLHRDCTELVKRYAFFLGFYGPSALFKADSAEKLKDIGDGSSAAQGFARLSQGSFVYYPSGSSSLPKPGSVVSIAYFKGAKTGVTITGHTGILDNYSASNSATSVSIRLFDQNSPGDYKYVKFSKKNNRWTATWPNGGAKIVVVGWASPKN